MKRPYLILLWVFLFAAAASFGQVSMPGNAAPDSFASASSGLPATALTGQASSPAALIQPVALPRMAPELALQAFRGRMTLQAAELTSYSATTVIRAQLLDTSQSGEFKLERHYSAPRTLAFKALHFTGDTFVKSNVIVRLLQSEVDHVQKDDPAMTSITPANYKISYKGTRDWDSRVVHVYQLKPRHKRAGLFKGQIYLDAYSGSLVRAEGKLAKSPSLFVKKVEFVQDFADINSFTFPVHIHSEAQARVVGRTVVDIYDTDYQPVSSEVQAQASNGGF
jgi:hypothetical protein